MATSRAVGLATSVAAVVGVATGVAGSGGVVPTVLDEAIGVGALASAVENCADCATFPQAAPVVIISKRVTTVSETRPMQLFTFVPVERSDPNIVERWAYCVFLCRAAPHHNINRSYWHNTETPTMRR